MKPLTIAAAALALAFAYPGTFAHADGSGHKAPHKPHAQQPKGHGAELGGPGDPKKVSRTIEIAMGDDMRFKPASVEVKKGETIRFLARNHGRLKHEMVLGTMKELKEHAAHMRRSPEMSHDDPNAVSVEPGKTGTLIWQFTEAGRFDFACLVPGHFEAGMTGKVVVDR
jgi:uncharacterized cupredoxin-like copper-binding protein